MTNQNQEVVVENQEVEVQIPQITIFDVLIGIQQGGIQTILDGDQIKVKVADELLQVVSNGVEQTLEHLQAVMLIARHLGMEFKPEVLAAAQAAVDAQAQIVEGEIVE